MYSYDLPKPKLYLERSIHEYDPDARLLGPDTIKIYNNVWYNPKSKRHKLNPEAKEWKNISLKDKENKVIISKKTIEKNKRKIEEIKRKNEEIRKKKNKKN